MKYSSLQGHDIVSAWKTDLFLLTIDKRLSRKLCGGLSKGAHKIHHQSESNLIHSLLYLWMDIFFYSRLSYRYQRTSLGVHFYVALDLRVYSCLIAIIDMVAGRHEIGILFFKC